MDPQPEVGARRAAEGRRRMAGGSGLPPPDSRGCSGVSSSCTHPRPPASLALFQRFTSQLTRGSLGCLGGTQLLPRAPVGPQGSRQHRRGPRVTPAAVQAHPWRLPGALRSQLWKDRRALGCHCARVLLETRWAPPAPLPPPPPGSPAATGARAQSGAAAAQHSGGARQAFFHPARSFQDRFARNAPHTRRSPGPTGGPAVTPPKGAVRGLRGGRSGTDLCWSRGGSLPLRLALPRVAAQGLGPWARPTCLPPAKVLGPRCQYRRLSGWPSRARTGSNPEPRRQAGGPLFP